MMYILSMNYLEIYKIMSAYNIYIHSNKTEYGDLVKNNTDFFT